MPRDYEALRRYLADRSVMPFAWGDSANDCVSHVLGAVTAATGRQVGHGFRWTSAVAAARIVEAGGGLAALFDWHFDRMSPAAAQRGDIAGVDGDYVGGIALLVVDGQHLVGPGGQVLPRSAMTIAWSVD